METSEDRARVIERASLHLANMPPAIAGAGRHRQMYRAIQQVGCGFDLARAECSHLLREEYSPRCFPRWSRDEVEEKVESAYGTTTRRGWHLVVRERQLPETPYPRADRNMPEPCRDDYSNPRAWEGAHRRWVSVMRASAILDGLEGARAGCNRHAHTLRVIREIGLSLGLEPEVCFDLLWNEWNRRCEPPWPVKKLERRVRDVFVSTRWKGRRMAAIVAARGASRAPQASALALATA